MERKVFWCSARLHTQWPEFGVVFGVQLSYLFCLDESFAGLCILDSSCRTKH